MGSRNVVDQNRPEHRQHRPRESAPRGRGEGRDVDRPGNERGGLRQEDRPHEHHQPHGEEAHEAPGAAAQVLARDLGKAGAAMPQRYESGQQVVHAAHEDAAQRDPHESHRTVGGTEHGAEDRPQARDVEQLDEEGFPQRQRHVVHAVERLGRGHAAPRIDTAEAAEIASVHEVGRHEQREADQKSNHRIGF